MADLTANDIVKRYERLKAARVNWEEQWRDIGKFVVPRKDSVWDSLFVPGGEKKRTRLYDGSAEHFNDLLASALSSMLTNSTQQWFELSTGIPELDNNNEVREYLQKLAKRMHQILNNSNFHTQAHESYVDLGGFGTTVLRMEEDSDSIIRFNSIPIYENWIAQNNKGIVDTIYNVFKFTARQMEQAYGADVFDEQEKLKYSGDDNTTFKILKAVFPRDEVDKNVIGGKSKAFASFEVLLSPGKIKILKEDGFNEFPFAVPRWSKISSELYGRSPGMKAMPDIKMLNSIMRDTIRSAQKVTDPPLMVPDDMASSPIDMTPGGLNPYRAGTQDRIFPLETKGQPRIGFDVMADVRQRVKAAFFIDQLQLREGPQMTATEVNQRTDEYLRLLGPILARMNTEFLNPVIQRLKGIMERKGLLPGNVPEALQKADLEVFYSSQIARAQRLAEAANFNRFVDSMMPLIEIDPSVIDNFNLDIAAKNLARLHGVDETILEREDTVAETREARAEQEAKAQQQQDQLMEAETLNKVAPLAQG